MAFTLASTTDMQLPGGNGNGKGTTGWGGFWTAIGQIGKGTLDYLANKDLLKAQRDIAKAQSGAGGGILMEMMLQNMLRGGGVQQPTYTVPQTTVPLPGGYGTGTINHFAQPTLTPAVTGGPLVNQPYVQQADWSATLGGPTGITARTTTPPSALAPSTALAASAGGGIIDAPAVWTQTMGGIRGKSFFAVVNPVSGNLKWYRSAGRPILWSGDLRACKRVNKVASRARRSQPRKRTTRRRR